MNNAAMGGGAALQLLGIGANAYGEHQGIRGLERAKTAQNREQMAYDAERQRLLGHYLDEMAPVGASEGAMASEQARLAGAATAPGVVQAGSQALGISGASPITASSRVGVRRSALGSRLGVEHGRRAGLDADIEDVERRRADSRLLYPELDRAGAKRGSGWRQMGQYLGAGGQALTTYGMMEGGGTGGQPGSDPNGYSNNIYATDRLSGPSQYRG